MCFLSTLVHFNVAYCITKIEILAIIQKFWECFTIWVMTKLLRCMPSFQICFLASRDYCRINLIFSSSLQKFSTMLFILDPMSGGDDAKNYILNCDWVDALCYLNSLAIACRDSYIFRLLVPHRIIIRS